MIRHIIVRIRQLHLKRLALPIDNEAPLVERMIDPKRQSPPCRSTTSLHLCDRSSLALVSHPLRLYQLDTSATVIALALEEGLSAEAVTNQFAAQSARDVREVRRHVDAIQRMLWPNESHMSQSGGVSDGILRWRQADSPAVAKVIRKYRLLDSHFLCNFADETSLECISKAFDHLEDQSSEPTTSTFTISASCGRLRIHSGERQLDGELTSEMLVNALRLVLIEASLAASKDEWAAHAAAVVRGERAILLPGPAGQGKSTFALGLGAAGYTVLGDDTVVLSREALDVRALPFPLCVKRGSWDIARTLLKAPDNVEHGRRMDGLSVRWLSRAAGVPLAHPEVRATVAHVVFPAFDKDSTLHVRKLTSDETLGRLIPSLHAVGCGLTAGKLDRLIAWVQGRACFEFKYSRLGDAVAALDRLMS